MRGFGRFPALVLLVAAAGMGCDTGGDDGEGTGGAGGTGGQGGTGGSEAPACQVTADCAAGEFCILDGTCAALCTSDDECPARESCVEIETGGVTVCRPAAEPVCAADADCGEGQICAGGTCIVPADCSEDADCAGGEVCVGGACIEDAGAGCADTAACYPDGAYCAELAAGPACVDVACGSDLNSCSRCALGPNAGAMDPSGPLLFYPEQVGRCSQDPNQCLPGAAPFVCEFSFLAYDPDGDLPTSGLNEAIRVITAAGTELATFGTGSQMLGSFQQYRFRSCFPETSSGNIGTAIVLRDRAGNASQSLCVDGSLAN